MLRDAAWGRRVRKLDRYVHFFDEAAHSQAAERVATGIRW